MKTLIKAGTVYTVTGSTVDNGGVAVSGGVVESVLKADEVDSLSNDSPGAFDRIIDLSDHILLPGFVNAHSHLQLAFAKGKIEYSGSFTDWIRRVIALSGNVSDEERNEAIVSGISEMLESGITAVADIVTDAGYAQKLVASPLRSVVFVEAVGPISKGAAPIAKTVRQQLKALAQKKCLAGISPHAPYTVSKELLVLLNKTAAEMGLPVMVHLSETPEESEFLKRGTGPIADLLRERGVLDNSLTTGATPVKSLDAAGALEKILAVHLNDIDSGDIDLLKLRGVTPVFCPRSSAWFKRKKVMPFDKFIESGPPPAIGTDSLASDSSLSMLDELRAALEFFPAVSREQLIEAATINGASALGLSCGAIEKGKSADVAGFRMGDFTDPLEAVFNAKKADFVMISGKVQIDAQDASV